MMKQFKLLSLLAVVILVWPRSGAAAIRSNGSVTQSQSTDQKTHQQTTEKAAIIWEQAIAAKGGRERLHAIRNIVVSSQGRYQHRSKRYSIRQEELIVFPDKYWCWNDLRPDVFGLTVEMSNYETNMHYIVSLDATQSTPQPIIDSKQGREELFIYVQLLYLLETKWLKPTLIEATTEKIGSRKVDVVRAKVLARRVDFEFDFESHRLIRARIYRTFNEREVLAGC